MQSTLESGLDKINPLRGGGAEAPLPSSVVEGSASILSAGHIFRRGAEVFSLFIFVAVFHTAVESVVLVLIVFEIVARFRLY